MKKPLGSEIGVAAFILFMLAMFFPPLWIVGGIVGVAYVIACALGLQRPMKRGETL